MLATSGSIIIHDPPHNSDVRRSKLLSGSARCDLCRSPISILQKKAIGELYPVVPVSSCAFNVCMRKLRSFKFFPIQTSIEQTCKRAPLVLHGFVRHKYLREDHSLAQTVV